MSKFKLVPKELHLGEQCLGWGKYEGFCTNQVVEKSFWCSRCDKLRQESMREHRKRFEELKREFGG